MNTPSVRPFMPVMPHTPVMSPGENEVLSMLQTQQALLTQALDGQKEIAQRQKDAEERQRNELYPWKQSTMSKLCLILHL